MTWTEKKPVESGWYEYTGDLQSIGGKKESVHCAPCRVAVHFGRSPFLFRFRDTELYDCKNADGLWSEREEPLEEPEASEWAQGG